MITKFGKQVHLQDLTQMRPGASDTIKSRSRDKLKTLCLRYESAYGHQTWHGGNLH